MTNPIDISVFRSYIYIARGSATTPLFDTEFDHLRNDIGRENRLPGYVVNSIARPIPLRTINSANWIEISNTYRRCFILEKQFRQFYVDYFIRDIGDKKQFYTECRCQRSDMNDSFMDYVMHFSGKLLPVEVKLSVSAETNIIGQVSKYVYNSKVFLTIDGDQVVTDEKFYNGKVLIIDTERLYMFDAESNSINAFFDLDRIRSKVDLETVKQAIIKHLK